MDRLTDATELLDGPLDDPRALADNLRDLRRINRWLGGVSLSASAIVARSSMNPPNSTMLDVGTGGADIPLALIERARANGTSAAGSWRSTAGPKSSPPPFGPTRGGHDARAGTVPRRRAGAAVR